MLFIWGTPVELALADFRAPQQDQGARGSWRRAAPHRRSAERGAGGGGRPTAGPHAQRARLRLLLTMTGITCVGPAPALLWLLAAGVPFFFFVAIAISA
jgi:hypothetical protein